MITFDYFYFFTLIVTLILDRALCNLSFIITYYCQEQGFLF